MILIAGSSWSTESAGEEREDGSPLARLVWLSSKAAMPSLNVLWGAHHSMRCYVQGYLGNQHRPIRGFDDR